MPRPTKSKVLAIWMNGERVGQWIVDAHGQDELHYDKAWMDSDRGRPVSLSMPFRPADPYKGEVVRNFFENLLPDNSRVRTRIAKRFNTTSNPFNLLAEIGRDCVGAIQLLPENDAPKNPFAVNATPMSEQDIERHLLKTISDDRFATDEEKEFRISLAGNQEKTAFLRWDNRWSLPHGSTPTTHIFKLPLGMTPRGIDLTTSVENEWICSEILKAYRIDCADTEMLTFGSQKVLSVTRFDREARPKGDGFVRLPQEDFAQVFGVSSDEKYEESGGPGIDKILSQLLGSERAELDRKDFFRTQVLFWMLAALDGHSKNFSVFIQRRGAFALTPRYDVLSAHPVMGHSAGQISPEKAKMAMAVVGKNRHYRWHTIQRRHFEETATRCKVPDATDLIDKLITMTPAAIAEVAEKLPKTFPDKVAQPIFNGLKAAAEKLEIRIASKAA